jgi:estrone sulfotransferase
VAFREQRNRVYDRLSVELSLFFHLFCQGVTVCGLVWNHYLEYWNESKARPDKESS